MRALSILGLLLAASASFACGGEPPPPPQENPNAFLHAAPPVDAGADGQAADFRASDADVDKAAQAYLDLLVQISPQSATGLGIHTRDSDLDDLSNEGFEAATTKEDVMLGDLAKRFANPNLSLRGKIDLDILTHTLAVDIRARREVRPLQSQPDVYCSPMNAIYLMTAREYAPAADRANNVLARMEKIPALLDSAKKNLNNPPKVWTEIGIESAQGAKTFFDDQRTFLVGALPNDKARIEKDIKIAREAYLGYAKFLKTDVLPRSSGNYAAGKPLFEFMLHQNYFLTEDSDALLARGKKVFDETLKQLDEVAKKIDPNAKSWFDVTAKVKKNHPTAADLIPSYDREVKRARQFLVDKDAVEFPKGDDCTVTETPPFERSTITAAYDQPPPFDPVTKGFFFVTPVDPKLPKAQQEEMLRENDHGDQVDTAVHETYPGHHLQLSFARLNTSLIRKATSNSSATAIFAEGWGLYSEELMSELGYYTPEERLMQLEWTLVRAARVLIDIGLHTQGMKFEDGVKMLTDQVHLEKTLAVSEVKRYTESPTQPLSYLIGREKIFDMRARYKQAQGANYSLKKFHTEVLSHGTIVPGLIEREMFAAPPGH
ncbi:MAG: DUF885 domain-containing protein [Polyangiaceae bacterium]